MHDAAFTETHAHLVNMEPNGRAERARFVARSTRRGGPLADLWRERLAFCAGVRSAGNATPSRRSAASGPKRLTVIRSKKYAGFECNLSSA
jgi:hypothetical protein